MSAAADRDHSAAAPGDSVTARPDSVPAKTFASVSAIIPAYNAAAFLSRCMESILAQTHPVSEIIIVNDGSQDDTGRVAESWAARVNQTPAVGGEATDAVPTTRVRVLHQENGGLAHARNVGIRAASGEWIALLDADDQWRPEKIAVQVATAQANPDCALIYTDATVVLSNGEIGEPFLRDKRPQSGWVFDRLLESCFLLPSSVMVRRDELLRAGLFSESLRRVEDYDLWLRMARTVQFCLVPQELTIYERQSNSLSKNESAMSRAEIGVLKALSSQTLTGAQRRSLNRRLARRLFELSYHQQRDHPSESAALAWECMRTDPLRLANVKRWIASLVRVAVG